MKSYLVPIGMRCNASLITNAIVNQRRFPFDWIQMNVGSMIDVIRIEENSILEYWKEYFSCLDSTKHHVKTGSWFPHDEFSTEEEKEASIQKYTRRTERLVKVLDSLDHKVFLIFFGFPQHDSLPKAYELMDAIVKRTKGSYSFIVCNATTENREESCVSYIYDKLENIDNNSDINWDILTKKNEERVRKIIESKGYELNPFT